MRTISLELTPEEAESVHHALYLRLQQLAMIEDHNPEAHRRARALRDAAPVLRAADKLKTSIEETTLTQDGADQLRNYNT